MKLTKRIFSAFSKGRMFRDNLKKGLFSNCAKIRRHAAFMSYHLEVIFLWVQNKDGGALLKILILNSGKLQLKAITFSNVIKLYTKMKRNKKKWMARFLPGNSRLNF